MLKTQTHAWQLAVVIWLLATSSAGAQQLQPFGPVDIEPTFDLFAPFEINTFGPRPEPNEGFFAVYERLNWATTTPRKRSIGAGRTIGAIHHFQDPQNIAVFPQPNQLDDGIDLHVPEAAAGWGNRFELGYVADRSGWIVGVINSVRQPQSQLFGLAETTSPIGTVAVTFDHAPGLLDGFVDLRGPESSTVGANGGPDQFADDVDGDGFFGPDGQDTDGDGVPDAVAPTDFDDLVSFLPTFDSFVTTNQTIINGVEVMKLYRFRPLDNGTFFDFGFGARLLSIDDTFQASGIGGTLGDSNWTGEAENRIIGPQVSLRWLNQRKRWRLSAEGRFVAGYNIQNLKVHGEIGSQLEPGALNRPLFFNPTTFRREQTDDQFSPVAELRLETAYAVTKRVALRVGWTGVFVGRVARGSRVIGYSLPEPTLVTGTEPIFTNGVNFGIEINR